MLKNLQHIEQYNNFIKPLSKIEKLETLKPNQNIEAKPQQIKTELTEEEQKRKLAEVDSGTFEFPENVKTKEAVVYSKELQETDYYKELEIDIDLKK